MPTLITETVAGELLTMIEPYYLVTIENKGVMWFLRGTAWTSIEERATEHPTIDAAAAAAMVAGKFLNPGVINECVIVGRGNDFV